MIHRSMMKHFLAWSGGALLCCSAISLVALNNRSFALIGWIAFFLVALSHGVLGFLVIEGHAAKGNAQSAGKIASAGLAALSTTLQTVLALALGSALDIHVAAATAAWLLAVGCIGLWLLVAVASRDCKAAMTFRLASHAKRLQRTKAAEVLRG